MKVIMILALSAAIAASVAAQIQNPKEILQRYNDADKAAVHQAEKAKDFSGYEKTHEKDLQVVRDALKSVDPTKVDPKDAYVWAQLYSLTENNKTVCDLTHMFLTTNPLPKAKFDDQMLMMQSCANLGEAEMLKSTLLATVPPTKEDCVDFAGSAKWFVDVIASKEGDREGLKLLDTIQKEITLPDPKKVAEEKLDKEKSSPASNLETGDQAAMTDAEKLKQYEEGALFRNQNTLYLLANERAGLLLDEGKKVEALGILQDFQARNRKLNEYTKQNLSMLVNQVKATGSPELALKFERTVGDFTSLANLRGKVVLVDFFAHWCGPCMASVPSMATMYGELHSKGLEIVGVTQFYGYFAKNKNLSKDDEFAKLQGLLKDKNMTWPIVVGPKDNAAEYGVYGIPETVLIDKKGIIRNIFVGYDPAQEEKVKQATEKLLQE